MILSYITSGLIKQHAMQQVQVQVICLEFMPQNDHCNFEALYNITYDK